VKTTGYNNNWQVVEEYDGGGTVKRKYLYGNYIDEVLYSWGASPSDPRTYYVHDHLYSPVALVTYAGAVVERYEYDAYGKPTIHTDPGPDGTWLTSDDVVGEVSAQDNCYLFTGREVDVLDGSLLKLQYNRNRYYDYYAGRWLTQDAVGYVDGLNLYKYGRGVPLLVVDPDGATSRLVTTQAFEMDLFEADFGHDDHVAHFELTVAVGCVKTGDGSDGACCWRPYLADILRPSWSTPESMGWPYGLMDRAGVPNYGAYEVMADVDGHLIPFVFVHWKGEASEGSLQMTHTLAVGLGASVGAIVGAAIGGSGGTVGGPAGTAGGGLAGCIKGGSIGAVVGGLVGRGLAHVVTVNVGKDFGGYFLHGILYTCSCTGEVIDIPFEPDFYTYGDDELYWGEPIGSHLSGP